MSTIRERVINSIIRLVDIDDIPIRRHVLRVLLEVLRQDDSATPYISNSELEAVLLVIGQTDLESLD